MPRRILLLITDLQIGGTPTVVRELAIRLREPGRVEVEVACLSPWGPVADQLRAAGVTVTALGGTGPVDLPIVLWKLIRLIRDGRFDTVFSFLIHANAVAAAASVFCRGVQFLHSIQTTQPRPKWHWKLQRIIHPLADAVVVPSSSAARAAEAWAGVPPGRIVVIPNAVDVAAFDEIYRNPKPVGDVPQVGFIGRLDPIKRAPLLLEAMTHLTSAHLHLFGDGVERTHIEREIRRFGLYNQVTLHGAIARPQEALSEIDVLVLPSAAEGFGLVLIEAMAAGVPVVGTDVPGIRDVIDAGRTGWLVRGDPLALSVAVREAVSARWRSSIVPAARAVVERRYAWPAVLEQYRRVLRLPQDVGALADKSRGTAKRLGMG